MKKSVLLLFLVTFSLLSLSALKEKSDAAVSDNPIETAETTTSIFSFPVKNDNSIVEISPVTVPAPARNIRKTHEELQLRGFRLLGAYSPRQISVIQSNLYKTTGLPVASRSCSDLLFHEPGYIMFGTLII